MTSASRTIVFLTLFCLVACSSGPTNTNVALFEGARLITGYDMFPLADSAFIIQASVFKQFGTKGELKVPAGARRVNLTGKTVMPLLISLHTHTGYLGGSEFLARNYTRESIIDDLHRFAYY